jgi:uncharacterized membrane protein YccC
VSPIAIVREVTMEFILGTFVGLMLSTLAVLVVIGGIIVLRRES